MRVERWEQKHWNIRQEGTLILRGTFLYPILALPPQPPGKRTAPSPKAKQPLPKSPGFYERLAAECQNYLKKELVPLAKKQFSEDSNPEKRFFFPFYRYRFEVQEKPDCFCLCVTLSRQRTILSSFVREQYFDNMLLSPPPKKK